MTRKEWVSGVYQEMTGETPPESFWETPSGRKIMENNPTLLYDQPTANLYQVIGELPPEVRAEIISRIRSRWNVECSDDEQFLVEAICQSAFRFFSRNEALFRERETRYQKSAEPEKKAQYRELLKQYERSRNLDSVVFLPTVWKNLAKSDLKEKYANYQRLRIRKER
ncbi:MAG: hypothetical protein IJK52_12575 [Oscillospiraceae bacterium]|nr:hypothetical protein [Oscillospiraceae bacterium]